MGIQVESATTVYVGIINGMKIKGLSTRQPNHHRRGITTGTTVSKISLTKTNDKHMLSL